MGYNLLVFASSSERLAFCSFVFGLLRVWTAAGRLYGRHQNPWVDLVSSRIFLRSDASRHQLGTFVGIFLFYVVVGLSGWTIWQDPFDDFTNLTRPSVEKWTLAIHLSPWLDNDKGGLATSVMPLRLPYCSARKRREQEVEEAALLSKSRLWRDIEREGSVIFVFANGGLL
jgi:hypothetical protein